MKYNERCAKNFTMIKAGIVLHYTQAWSDNIFHTHLNNPIKRNFIVGSCGSLLERIVE